MVRNQMADKYIMESPFEGERVRRKTDAEATISQLNALGLIKGMHSLDIGCASGAVTLEMAKIAYPAKVIGIDRSEERINEARTLAEKKKIKNVEFVTGDVYNLPFAKNKFDFLWNRFLFEYLKKPINALEEMKRITKEGGYVVTGDLDGNSLFHYPIDSNMEKGLYNVTRFLSEFGFDAFVGRKLFHYYQTAGFSKITPYLMQHHLIAGTPSIAEIENWTEKTRTIRKNFGSIYPDKEGLEFVLLGLEKLIKDPNTFTYSTLIFMKGEKA